MKIGIALTYSDIFDSPPPKIEELLQGISSELTIKIFSLINSYLYLGKGNEAFFKIFSRVGDIPITNIKRHLSNQEMQVNVFFIAYTLRFIEYEIINFREISLKDTTPTDELKILKAYFIIAKGQEQKLNVESNFTTSNFFYKRSWAIILHQFSIKTDPFIQMVKGVLFLNYFLSQDSYREYVNNYLKLLNLPTVWDYCLNLIRPLTNFDKELKKVIFSFKVEEELAPLFNHFSLDPTESYSKLEVNYINIKEKPLLKHSNNDYIVIYWDFLTQKVFNGLVQDFKNKSGILEHDSFKKGKPLKSYIGEEIGEKIIFRRITNYCFHDASYTSKVYDKGLIDGFPDLYYRNGNHIFIFEFKDISISSHSIDDYSSENFINEIEKKLIKNEKGKPKGITQLKNFISKLAFKTFDSDYYLSENRKKITIYPIIVYTDKILSAPGVNKFFKDKFENLFDGNLRNNIFKKIHDVVLIDIDFFINNCRELKSKKIRLKDLISNYNSQIRKDERKNLKDNNIDRYHHIYRSFETFANKKLAKKRSGIELSTIKELVEEFNLKDHLPEA